MNKIIIFILSFLFFSCYDDKNSLYSEKNIIPIESQIEIIDGNDFQVIEVDEYWINNQINSAKLYVYLPELNESNGRNIVKKGNVLNNTIIESLIINLDSIEINRIQNLLKRKTNHIQYGADCFNPHHGIVLRNVSEEVIGHFSICFECSNYSSFPNGTQHIPIDEFMSLFLKHKLPITRRKIWGFKNT